MKKNFTRTAFAMAMGLFSLGASAQNYDFGSHMFDVPGYGQITINGYFHHVSANGKYAVGYDEDFTPFSFIWNADKPGELELLEPMDMTITACDITNDGVVYGSMEDEEGYTYPAYMTTDGVWHKLPVPEHFSMVQAKSQTFMNEARAVSKDGKYVAGNFYAVLGRKWNSWKKDSVDATALVPCLWENGEIKAVYDKFKFDKDKFQNDFMVYDISDDGSVIVGMNTAKCGGNNPAIIKNGELINIIDCDKGEVDDDGYVNPRTFNGGVATSIDTDGNVYLYFQEDDGSVGYYIYTKDGELTPTDHFYICAAGGKKFYSGNVGLGSVVDCSEDGSVVVGGNIVSIDYGQANVPALVVYPKTDGVKNLIGTKDDVKVRISGNNTIVVDGEYNKAEVYSASGALVATDAHGKTISLGNIPSGTYIVKVSIANGILTFKFAK